MTIQWETQQQHCVSHFICDILLTCFRIAMENRARASRGMRMSRINDYWSIAIRSDGRSPDMNICRILFIRNVDGKQIAASSSRLCVSIWKPCKYTRDIGFSFTCKSNKGTGFILSMLSSCPRNMDADPERILLFTRHIVHCTRTVAAAGSVIKFSFACNSFETGTAGACEYADTKNIVETVWQMVLQRCDSVTVHGTTISASVIRQNYFATSF